ncbi:thiosulfate sulfurtransferase 16, chloroplastic [Impatiens glandulifera]|uniref:thiosulfate sulfurtransferase 16, chloroplastic n=1 Tax=Impatiens glandulifera TaxID=253017 RepID=UPI001FB0A471|nr:thiosulfate sulfurtransferase 16, chloroplastic [Impatiens glandulifera]
MLSKIIMVQSISSTLPQLLHHYPQAHTRRVNSISSRLEIPKNRNNIRKILDSTSWVATAAGGGNVQSVSIPTSVPVRVAHELLLAGHRYLDVRTPEEFSAGHLVGAINVPYLYRVGSGMTKNSQFLEEVLSHFGKDDEIIVGCQLGKRSFMAATDLVSSGFTGITDMAGGYAAWTQIRLPIES